MATRLGYGAATIYGGIGDSRRGLVVLGRHHRGQLKPYWLVKPYWLLETC